MLMVPPESAGTAKAMREQTFSTATAPKIESGTDIMMMSGSRKLSNCAASTR